MGWKEEKAASWVARKGLRSVRIGSLNPHLLDHAKGDKGICNFFAQEKKENGLQIEIWMWRICRVCKVLLLFFQFGWICISKFTSYYFKSVNLYQCFTYERAGQDLSKTCKSILVVVSIAVALSTIFAGTGAVESFGWFQVLSFMSYIKVGSSLIKYMPQVYLNWKRKCTLGFAIDMGKD